MLSVLLGVLGLYLLFKFGDSILRVTQALSQAYEPFPPAVTMGYNVQQLENCCSLRYLSHTYKTYIKGLNKHLSYMAVLSPGTGAANLIAAGFRRKFMYPSGNGIGRARFYFLPAYRGLRTYPIWYGLALLVTAMLFVAFL